jgi:uncharacterized protein
MLEKLNRINLLFDLYASLLTERQQEVLHFYFSDNFSLGEIAGEYEISRQAVYDLIRRSLGTLEKLETKLGLYRLFNEQQKLLAEVDEILNDNSLSEDQIVRLKEIVSALRSSIEQ